MLCKWSTSSTNTILRSFACRSSAFSLRRHGANVAGPVGRSPLSTPAIKAEAASFFTSTFTSGAMALTSRPASNAADNDSRPLEDPDSHHQVLVSLRPGQVSRATAQAVRLSMQKGKFGDALYLINSLLESHNPNPAASPRTKLMQSELQASAWTPIDFGQPISPNLCAHAFLHGLTRNGFGNRAAAYVETFEECGLRIRPATITAILRSLTTSPNPLPLGSYREQGAIYRLRQNGVDGEHVLKLRSDMVADACTQAAVRLLLHARIMGERRMAQLYGRMINWLLLQGELVAGALFVVLFIKSLEAQRARSENPDAEIAVDAPLCPDGGSPFIFVQLRNWFSLPRSAVDCMDAVLDKINTVTETSSLPEADQDSIGSALQALASLTILLDTGQLPTSKIAKLLRTISSCPKTGQYVWILDRTSRKPVRVKAYPYFHNVLMRHIHSLTKPDPNSPPPRPINVASYNALLFYALRHRLSPALAADILDHMCAKGNAATQPTAATYNTLLRAGTLFRRRDITDDILRAVWQKTISLDEGKAGLRGISARRGMEQADQGEAWKPLISFLRSIPTRQKSAMESVRRAQNNLFGPDTQKSRVLTRLSLEEWRVPSNFYQVSDNSADVEIITNYILYATATGRPRIVTNTLFRALPQLSIVDHPTWCRSNNCRPSRLSHAKKKLYLRQAVHFGPQFFSALLDALAKVKRTGAAERVWLLAKAAEEASWRPGFAPDVEPWCLPVAAYTSMMRCYAEEAKKAIKLVQLDRAARTSLLPLNKETSTPRFVSAASSGWACFVKTIQKIRRHERRYYWRRRWNRSLPALLHRCMIRAGLELYESLRVMSKKRKPYDEWTGSLPMPDERFYNEALNLLSRGLDGAPRPRRTTARYWRARARRAWRQFRTRGEKSKNWTPMLQMIVQDLVAAGLPVPAALRVDAVGHMDHIVNWSGHARSVLALRPYAFPRARTRFRAHALPTVKIRGLPLPITSHTRRHRHRHAIVARPSEDNSCVDTQGVM